MINCKTTTNSNKKIKETAGYLKTHIDYTVNYNKDSIIIDLFNNNSDTSYIFSSYYYDSLISKYLYDAPLFHRYNAKQNVYKLSLLPILPFMSTRSTDRVVLKKELRVKTKGQILFDFITLPPHSRCQLTFEKDRVFSGVFIKDFEVEFISCYDHLLIDDCLITPCNTDLIYLELAIYKDVNKIYSSDFRYLSENDYDLYAKQYIVLKIPLVFQYTVPSPVLRADDL
ncbi:MAG: hypothetical protein IKZ50_07490 [Bacteroidales bacterium]|nr:hypothetical protein [Bacteroidales bacterium]